MFVKPIKKIQQQYLSPFLVTNDPHGRLLAFYLDKKHIIYIVATIKILQLMQKYRKKFENTLQYSLKQSLKSLTKINNLRLMMNVQFIKFTQNIKEIQFLVVVYFSSFIDLHSTVTSQILHTVQIQKTLMNINIYGHSLYLGYYNLQLQCYQGNQLKPIKDQSMRFCYQKSQNNKKKQLIYQVGLSKLMIGKKVIQQFQTHNNSQQQFLFHQISKIDSYHTPFSISLCHRFMICCDKKIYRVRYKFQQWNEVYQCKQKPYINHFNQNLKDILIARIVDSGYSIIINKFNNDLVVLLKDLKHIIIDIWWIGPKILLALDKQKKIIYIQLNNSVL